MRHVLAIVFASGCAQVLDLPDQIVGYDEFADRMCTCAPFTAQQEGTENGEEVCGAAVSQLIADASPVVEDLVRLGCDRCGDLGTSQVCYSAFALPPESPCGSNLACGSFACGVVATEFTLGEGLSESDWKCVTDCVGCADVESAAPVDFVCEGTLTALIEDCDAVKAEVGKEPMEIAKLAATLCGLPPSCSLHPSRPVSP